MLEYLRGYAHRDVETVELPCEIPKLKALKREATFYRLPELVSQIQGRLQVVNDSLPILLQILCCVVKEREDRERREKADDDDADSTSSVIVREDVPSIDKECDVIFHSIASNQCHFTEA